MKLKRGIKGILLDVDGTLIDSNDAHAHAWVDALAERGFKRTFEEVRPLIGMGGDQLIPKLTGLEKDSSERHKLDKLRGQIFRKSYLPTLQAFKGAREMIQQIKARGLVPVIATSASQEDLEALLMQTSLDDLVQRQTNSDDAGYSKPEPDIVIAALNLAGLKPEEAIMIGDTPYDIAAARRAGVEAIAFTCGGWSAKELEGAIAVYDGPWDFSLQLESGFADS